MIDDYDWEILDKRLKALEDSLEMLKAMFPVQDSTPDVEYVLYQGDLTDAGTEQQWRSLLSDGDIARCAAYDKRLLEVFGLDPEQVKKEIESD
ncbi:MAG: hypothetical protein ACRC6V_01935 [Bacteroidales bacterium]